MLKIVPSNQLKKDLRLAQKRGCKIEYLQDVVNTLAAGRKLDKKYRIIH
jgi:mRNA interferase YafQ